MCVLILNRLRYVPVNHKFKKTISKEKREALRLLRTNFSKKIFEEINILQTSNHKIILKTGN